MLAAIKKQNTSYKWPWISIAFSKTAKGAFPVITPGFCLLPKEIHLHFILQKGAEVSLLSVPLPLPIFLSPFPIFKVVSPFSPSCIWLIQLKPDSSWHFLPSWIIRDFSFLPIICRCSVSYLLDRPRQPDVAFLGCSHNAAEAGNSLLPQQVLWAQQAQTWGTGGGLWNASPGGAGKHFQGCGKPRLVRAEDWWDL